MGDGKSRLAWTGVVIAAMLIVGFAVALAYFTRGQPNPPAANAGQSKGDLAPQPATATTAQNSHSVANGTWPTSSASALLAGKSLRDLYASIDASNQALESYRPDESFARVDEEIRGLPSGQVAFNVPSTMRRHDTASIELLLDAHKTVDQLKQLLGDGGSRAGSQIKISDQMEAQLTGAKFQVTANQPDIQAVGSGNTVRWTWDVVPAESGKLSLHLTLSALIDVGQSRSPMVVRTFDRNIDVRVTTGERVADFLGEHWEWLASTLVIPVGAVARARWRKRWSKQWQKLWRRRGGPTP